jgi:lanosterol synthase
VVSGHEEALRRGYLWLVETQLIEELPDHAREARDSIVGGWCFSDGQHRWPVSDCTAEALTALLELHERSEQILRPGERISDSRLVQAVEFILARQNDDGGFGSYERRRGSQLLEWVNPSEMYGNCMTERSYTECTASCVGALARFRRHYPEVLRARIDRAITAAVALLRARQRDDGSWVGFWGVNFTYAIFHVTEALLAAGVPASDTALQRAARWLLGRQRADGGWGEHYSSCLTEEYVEHPESQAAMTAWALLALVETLGPGHLSVERARLCLERLQLVQPVDETTAPSRPGMLPRLPVGAGGWPHQAQAGVFFSTAMLDYRLYKDLFPTWALGRHAALALHLRRN